MAPSLGLAELDLHVGPLRDQQRVVARLRVVDEELPHFFRGLQIELVGVELEPVRVVERRAGLDAQQRGVRLGVLLVGVVRVVGGEQPGVELARHLHELRVDVTLFGQTVVLELDEERVAPEDVLETRRRVARRRVIALHEPLAHEPAQAAARRDETLAVVLEQLEVDAGLRVEAVEVGVRRDLDEVAVAGVRLGEERQVEDLVVGAPRPIEPAAAREVRLRAEDRSEARFPRRPVEVENAVHVPVVGDPDCRLAVGGRGGDDVGDAGGAVEHGELGVQMQVHERARQGAATPFSPAHRGCG